MRLTTDEIKEILPPQVRKNVSQDVIDIINNVIGEPEFVDQFRENLVGYQSVLSQGKYKLTNYVEAVKYVSHKMMGCKNKEAFYRAFPEKIADYKRRGIDELEINRLVYAFNSSKLVSSIFAQSMIPTHILNADVFQAAINRQYKLMMYAKSEKVQSDAATSLMVHLRPPEVKKMELDVKLKEDSSIVALRQATMELVNQRKSAIQAGSMTALQSAHSGLILEGELDD